MLTAKQEAFCKAIALEGLNQSDAYRSAYNTSTMKPETINNNAFMLAGKSEIAARIKELKDKIDKKVLEGFAKTRDDLLRELEELKIKANAIGDLKEQREDIKEQGKLLGYYIDNLKVDTSISLVEGMKAFKRRLESADE